VKDSLTETNHDKRFAQAETRTDQANTRTQQADLRTDQANTRTDEANVRTKEANTRTEHAEKSEQAMRASELSYRRLFEAARDGILILNMDTGRIDDVNPFLVELLGFSHAEMVGKTVGELSPFKDILSNQAMLERLQKDGYIRYENLPLQTRDGRHIEVEFVSNVYQAGVIKVIQCNIRDITERKEAEQRLNLLNTCVSRLNEIILVTEADPIDEPGPKIVFVNDAFERLTGYAAAETLGKSPRFLQGEKTDPIILSEIRSALAQQQPVKRQVINYKKDGTAYWMDIDIVPIFDAAGKCTHFAAIERDVTESKKSESRFRRLVDSNAQGVIFWNTKGEITGANDSFLKLARFTREDLEAGRINWMAMTPPEYADLDQRALQELAATGICATFEKEWIRKDGSRVPILLGAAMFEDNPNEGVCFVLDLTERKKIEAQFRQSQKMENIGTLAGGVAHDFNNILAVIQMQTDLFKADGEFSPAQAEFVEGIGAAAQRAAALTRQLLLFSRKQTMQPCDLDFNQSINNVTNMLRRILGEDIQLQFKFSLQPIFINADAGMMDQVLMNLAVNSRDAMPKGGQLIIETAAVDFDETVSAQSAQARPGAFVCLSVSDNGCGIPPENLSRIFEPFFTTKEVGKGTGLGLATLFGIVQQHRGWVNVYSEPGQGTTFRIYLPRVAKLSLSQQKPEPPVLSTLLGGTETILLVEDDDFLRPSVNQTLTRLGYRVLETSNGAEALEVWKQHHDEIHLLLTDMVMPGGMTGRELGERLLLENPKLKVIYASGYSAEIVSHDFPLKEGVNFLTKPFQSQKLAQTIRDSLDKST
jgi:PAS domain S-box-containing protein